MSELKAALQEMNGAMAQAVRVMGAVRSAQQSAGLSDQRMLEIKQKLENQAALSDEDREALRALAGAFGPAIQAVRDELDDTGIGIATKLQGQFDALVSAQTAGA